MLAPGAGDTASTIESYAARLASQGLVALVIDYRGWGRSGAFIYMAEPIRWDDRLRFSQHTAKVRLRRKRLIPEAQITDIRNAITYLQGEPGVDRARIGVWGADLAGGHAVSVAAMDARVKAAVAHAPVIAGKDQPRAAWKPTAAEQADMVRLARLGAPTVTAATAGHGQRPGVAPRARAVPSVPRARRDSADNRRPVRRGRERDGAECRDRHGRIENRQGTDRRHDDPRRGRMS